MFGVTFELIMMVILLRIRSVCMLNRILSIELFRHGSICCVLVIRSYVPEFGVCIGVDRGVVRPVPYPSCLLRWTSIET